MPCAKPSKRAFLFTNHAPGQLVSGYNNITKDDDIIAVDNGLQQIAVLGLTPTLIIGDMDSVSAVLLQQYPSIPMLKHATAKKETDTELALLWCIDKGCYNKIIICNDMQDRFDHCLAIVQNLLMPKLQGIEVLIETATQRLFVLPPETHLNMLQGQTFSLVPLSSEVVFDSSVGLLYPLDSLTIKQCESRGISNRIISEHATIVKLRGEALASITISN